MSRNNFHAVLSHVVAIYRRSSPTYRPDDDVALTCMGHVIGRETVDLIRHPLPLRGGCHGSARASKGEPGAWPPDGTGPVT